jgi:hypothetical protein
MAVQVSNPSGFLNQVMATASEIGQRHDPDPPIDRISSGQLPQPAISGRRFQVLCRPDEEASSGLRFRIFRSLELLSMDNQNRIKSQSPESTTVAGLHRYWLAQQASFLWNGLTTQAISELSYPERWCQPRIGMESAPTSKLSGAT